MEMCYEVKRWWEMNSQEHGQPMVLPVLAQMSSLSGWFCLPPIAFHGECSMFLTTPTYLDILYSLKTHSLRKYPLREFFKDPDPATYCLATHSFITNPDDGIHDTTICILLWCLIKQHHMTDRSVASLSWCWLPSCLASALECLGDWDRLQWI